MRHPRRNTRNLLATALGALFAASAALAGAPSRQDAVLDAAVANERALASALEGYRPVVETYLQTVRPEPTLGAVPVNDHYFLGRLQMSGAEASKPSKRKSLGLFHDFHSSRFKPESFIAMLALDRGAFGREGYDFDLVGAEFLGEVRTFVFDVTPKPGRALPRLGTGRFTGRIWIEDREHHIVRFNGVYASPSAPGLHFDSWRFNPSPGVWLPAYVYTEEADRASGQLRHVHKGQTRIWGYEIGRPGNDDDFTKVLIEAPQVADRTDAGGPLSPVESARAWESEAENNVLRRLERTGLLAPVGEVDKVLTTVVDNLLITNALEVTPPVRCRVLLTTPLESFTVGHTIVVSRGLLDVLPDEASLASVLAHELGHVVSGHDVDTTFAFIDRILVGDREAMQNFDFQRDPAEELQADERAVALLRNSPYKDDLGKAGLFLKALELHAPDLPSLIRPHFGSRLANRDQLQRMPAIAGEAPELDPASIEQTAALPLGGRVRLDPWSARIELVRTKGVALLSAREKMPFRVTPLMPYLVRFGSEADKTTVANAGAPTP